GDADYYPVPIDGLISKEYAKTISERIKDNAVPSTEIFAGDSLKYYESTETTHYSVYDSSGNAVSVTTTINSAFGSKVVVEGAGFLLNNEMDDFSAKPGSPNMYGLIGGEANAIAPAKRMLSSMTPTIVEKDGELFMVVGTPGGSTIITSVFQAILNVIEFGLNMQGAVDFQRFHHQWKPDYIQYEKGRFDDYILEGLVGLGHKFKERSAIGRTDAILVLEDGRFEGGADLRGDDTAMGF
ncbi:MAG: gamma-glutamyltransferase, partial [Cyclobacteriaceae bacterium]|nr:gamma-glutamyltransferase [Cyclobacteriaceae bacterium]